MKHIVVAHHFIGYESAELNAVGAQFGKQLPVLKLYEEK